MGTAAAPRHYFEFKSQAVADGTFEVLRFEGRESLGALYSFDITLLSADTQLDLEAMLDSPSVLSIGTGEETARFHGILSSFSVTQQLKHFAMYTTRLVPVPWILTQTLCSQVFVDQTLPQIFMTVFGQYHLQEGRHYDLKLTRKYETCNHICQYNESHWDFLLRWMQRKGLYFFFDQERNGRMVITDNKIAHAPMRHGDALRYDPVSGLDFIQERHHIKQFHAQWKSHPKTVRYKDYNYLKPDLPILAEEEVSDAGAGDVFHYAGNIQNHDAAVERARTRAQALRSESFRHFGQCMTPFMQPGYTFEVAEYYKDKENRNYLCVNANHQGSQQNRVLAYLGLQQLKNDDFFYRNSFEAISHADQFRPVRTVPWPRMHGMLQAHVDGLGDAAYAELDDHGRYKVVLPFDRSSRPNGHNSCWLRKAESYIGGDFGMHFPLHRGTEVLLAFQDGDPDLPLIAGAVPNPLQPSLVTSENPSKSMITTAGGNKIHIEDKEDEKRLLFHVTKADAFMRLGVPNDPSDCDKTEETDELDGIRFCTPDMFNIYAGAANETVIGNLNEVTLGWEQWGTFRGNLNAVLGGAVNLALAGEFEFKLGEKKLYNQNELKIVANNFAITEESLKELSKETSTFATEKLEAVDDQYKAADQELKSITMDTSVAEKQDRITMEECFLGGEETRLADQKLRVHKEDMQMSGISLKMEQKKTEMAESECALDGETVQLAEKRSQECQERMELATSKMQMASEKTVTAATNMKL